MVIRFFEQSHCQIGGENIGYKKRRDEGYWDIGRDGLHKLPHHLPYKGHGYHREDNGQCCDIRRCPYLIGSFDHQFISISVCRIGIMKMAMNVFDNDNGRIHKQTKTEQKGKKGDTIDRLSREIRYKQRDC